MIRELVVRNRVDPNEVEDLIQLTYDSNPKVRATAVRALCPCHVKADVPMIWDRILDMIHDEDLHVRKTILHALGDGSPRVLEAEVVDALENMQHDSDPKLKRHVRKLLAHYRRTGKVNLL